MDRRLFNIQPSISDAGASAIVDAAVEAARALSLSITVVVVDQAGLVKGLRRMDGAPPVSVGTAMGKARAAAATEIPPDDFYEAINGDGAAVAYFTTHQDLALIAGGLTIRSNDAVAGGVGVAGAMTGAQDRQIALAALAAINHVQAAAEGGA